MKMQIILLLIVQIIFSQSMQAQVLEIKEWKGAYPEMENSYPLTFISFTGWLIPVPHVFVRTWPTHYYVKTGALPVTDAGEITGETKTGLLRIAAKALERSQLKGRYSATELIKINTELQMLIQQKVLERKSDQLEDVFNLASRFVELYGEINKLDELDNSESVKKIYLKEADHLLFQFLMINLFKTDNGSKLDAFIGIKNDLNRLCGELHYTLEKLRFFNCYESSFLSYSFLTQ